MEALLRPYLGRDLTGLEGLPGKLVTYLDLLLRWNARTNLTAVRDPEEIVQRHFGESIFAAECLRPHVQEGTEVLDLGSGAGFPGIPIQLLFPEVRVCLAESQGKKAAFLREAVRALGLRSEVWARRVEEMPDERVFGVVALRAVDRMEAMVAVGRGRVQPGGVLMEMVGGELVGPGEGLIREAAIPGRKGSWVRISRVE